MVALVYTMYEIMEKFVEDIIHLKWMTPKSKLVIIGGIMINADHEKSDRFLPLMFEIRTQTSTEDLFEDVFGKRPENIYKKVKKAIKV